MYVVRHALVYAYMFVCTYRLTCMSLYVCIHICSLNVDNNLYRKTCKNIYVCMHICIFTFSLLCRQIHMSVCLCMYACMSVCIHACIYIHVMHVY